jgi:hypothetical protein
MEAKKAEGRLVTIGDGHLRLDERELVGYKTTWLHDEDGDPILNDAGEKQYLNVPVYKDGPNHMKPISYDPETDSYIFIAEDAPSHNDRFHKQNVSIDLTSGTLFNERGEIVYKGDPHHDGPTPDDPNYDPTAPRNTRTTKDPDAPGKHKSRDVVTIDTFNLPVSEHEYETEEGDPTVTGHTEAPRGL